MDITQGLDDPKIAKGIVLSLRAYLGAMPQDDNRHLKRIQAIAYANDTATRALIQMQDID